MLRLHMITDFFPSIEEHPRAEQRNASFAAQAEAHPMKDIRCTPFVAPLLHKKPDLKWEAASE